MSGVRAPQRPPIKTQMENDSQASSLKKFANNRKSFFIGLISLFLIIAAVIYYKTSEPTLVGKWVNTSSLKDEYPDNMPIVVSKCYILKQQWNSNLKYIVTKPGVFEIRDYIGNMLENDTCNFMNGQLFVHPSGTEIPGQTGFTKIRN
jgi:hypothetical protein